MKKVIILTYLVPPSVKLNQHEKQYHDLKPLGFNVSTLLSSYVDLLANLPGIFNSYVTFLLILISWPIRSCRSTKKQM